MPPKSKRIGTINSKMPLQDGAIASNSSPQEVHQEVEHGAIGSALEHVSKFLDAMGPHVGDSNLCLREFSKSLTDRAYTSARKTAASVKPVERSRADKRSTLHALVVTSSNDTRNKKKRGKEKEFEEWPAIPCTTEEMHAVIDKWIADGFLRLPNVSKEPTEDDKKHARNPLPNHSKKRGAVFVVIHVETEDIDEELEDSLSINPTAIKTLQRSPKFRSLFNQLRLGPYARKAAIEAIVNIAAGSGSQCYTAEAHASQAFLETTNAVTFTDEDMEVQYPDHRKPLKKIQGIPMEVIGFGGAAEYTVGHIQLVLKVGSIVALTRFYVVNIAVSYHALLGRPWLHKHKLVLSIYHQCVKGCLNGKPISILANATLFDESEAHYVETAFYDEVTPTEEGLISKVVGTPLPRWEDIKDEPDMDLRKLLGCCVDFRNLNKACPKDEFPLPNMDLLIDSAVGHTMFSFMDGFSGYNQFQMSPKDAMKTTFRTPIGNFYYTVMPFGLKNADVTYQQAMITIFHDMMHCELEDYVDDVVVKMETREGHFKTLRRVFERCRQYKLHMNPLKCAFGVAAGKFQGFLVHQRGIDMDSMKAKAIATMKPPKTVKELKSFLGKLSYIRRFIPSLAIVTTTFTPLLKKAIKSQAIADLLAQFLGEDVSSINDEVPREVSELAFAKISDAIWALRFDGSSNVFGGGAGVVLTKEGGDTLSMSFKLDFPCSNNDVKYEAYLTGLALARELRIKRLKVRGDSNLVVSQAKEDFALKEPSLAPYQAMAQRLEDYFEELTIEYTQRSDNRHTNVLATLGSKSIFDGESADVTILKRSSPITQLLHEEFAAEPPQEEDWRLPLKESLTNP
uniref:Uncharacterized protein n=1 Tax=Fagus sylvatica TaxID=28930 RepID=A0A2N9F0E4_FAGSY